MSTRLTLSASRPGQNGPRGTHRFLATTALAVMFGSGLALAQQTGSTTATSTVTVRASGTPLQGVWPSVDLRVNGVKVQGFSVDSRTARDYSFSVPAIPSGARVDVVFTNDRHIPRVEDRNLLIDSITIDGQTLAPNATGVTLDRGAGTRAFDGIDVIPGQRGVYWNGALRFTAPQVAVVTPPPPPSGTLSAGGTLATALPNARVALRGTAPVTTVRWSQVSGPSPAAFLDAGAASTQVAFDRAGTYVLRLTQLDARGTTVASAETTVTVAPNPVQIGTGSTPLDHLRAKNLPIFREGHTLLPLTTSSCAINNDINVELVKNWGYGAIFNNGTNLSKLPNSNRYEDALVQFIKDGNGKYPAVYGLGNLYRLFFNYNGRFPENPILPADTYIRNPDGSIYLDGGNPVVSPIAPDSTMDMVGKLLGTTARNLEDVIGQKFTMVQNGGDAGGISDDDMFIGAMKTFYTAGTIGAASGYFTCDGAPFQIMSKNLPVGTQTPTQIRGAANLAKVHALFTFLEPFLRDGDLLPGNRNHPFRNLDITTPAMEFDVEGEVVPIANWWDPADWQRDNVQRTARVLARKMRNADRWLVTAWANTGNDRDVVATIGPRLGPLTLRARKAGSVYIVDLVDGKPRLRLVDEDAMNPTRNLFASQGAL